MFDGNSGVCKIVPIKILLVNARMAIIPIEVLIYFPALTTDDNLLSLISSNWPNYFRPVANFELDI